MHIKPFMKLVLALLWVAVPVMLQAQDFRAAYVDFMYVPEGMQQAYLQMEREIAMPVHEEAVKQGKLVSWSLWAIPFPGGTAAEYHYATVRIYGTQEQLDNADYFIDIFNQVHPEADRDGMLEQIRDTRDLVKTHRLFSWEVYFDQNLPSAPSMIQVVYFEVPFGTDDNYRAMELNTFKPLHQKEIEIGIRAGWEGWELQQPFGTWTPYTHVAVDMYQDWNQYVKQYSDDFDYDNMFSEVHPGKTQEQMMETFIKTVEMVKVEEWHLVENVEMEAPDTN